MTKAEWGRRKRQWEEFNRWEADHMLIGGLAVSAWGEPRSTLDVDVSVWVEPEALGRTVEGLCRHFRCPFSERPQDLEDARRLLRRFRKTLDRDDLEPRLMELAEALARPDILGIFRAEMEARP